MFDIERERLRREIFPKSNPPRQTLRQLISPTRLKRIKKRAVQRYAANQDRMWERWKEAVSE